MKQVLQRIIFTGVTILCLNAFLKAQNVVVVTVSNFSFSPATANITTTDTVKFILGSGGSPGIHTVTSDPSGALFNQTFSSSTTVLKVFGLAAGSYPYHCVNHGSSGTGGNIGTGMAGTIIVNAATGINDSKEPKFEFSAVPNPFDDQLSLDIAIGNKNITEIKIYDLIGKEVTSVNLSGKTGFHSYKVDTSNLRAGIYFCTVYTANGILETKKLFRRN